MTKVNSSIETISSPWDSTFYHLIEEVDSSILVAVPYIKYEQLAKILNTFDSKGLVDSVQFKVITDLSIDNLLSGSLDVNALVHLHKCVPGSTVTYLPGIHAKVYIADQMDRYASLGNTVDEAALEQLSQVTQELQILQKHAEKSMRRRFRLAFKQKVEQTRTELFKVRSLEKSTNSIFAETILYLLSKGPIKTTDLHPLIQRIHPDLCDDNIDRVINGVHFGKKWKHYVRIAQQYLKKKGLIAFDGTYWHTTDLYRSHG